MAWWNRGSTHNVCTLFAVAGSIGSCVPQLDEMHGTVDGGSEDVRTLRLSPPDEQSTLQNSTGVGEGVEDRDSSSGAGTRGQPPGKFDDATTCQGCDGGAHSEDSAPALASCSAGSWDHDHDLTTPCETHRECAAGQYVSAPGDARNDRTCSVCPEETFTTESNQPNCAAQVRCKVGEFVAREGSATDARLCASCATGSFSDVPNAATCAAWTTCVAPDYYQVVPPSSERDRKCAPCPPSSSAPEHNSSECVAMAFQMDADQVVFEAEHYSAVHNTDSDRWAALELVGVSGNGCMEIGPDDRSDWTEDPFDTAPRLDYFVNFSAAKTYYVHVRGDAGTSSDGFSDSCYVALDGVASDWLIFDDNAGVWGWVTEAIDVGSPGVHTVSVLAREDGFRVDKLVVSATRAAPEGDGPPESPLR